MRVDTPPLVRPGSVLTFSHPDCTVGPGVSPDPGACRPSALSPRRALLAAAYDPSTDGRSQSAATRRLERFRPPLAGFTADWELGRRAINSFPHPAPKVGFRHRNLTTSLRQIRQETECPLAAMKERFANRPYLSYNHRSFSQHSVIIDETNGRSIQPEFSSPR